jgi:nucleotide-binding universal stress UspA family protein
MTSGATQARLRPAGGVHDDTAARPTEAAPIVAAVDGSAANAYAVETAVNLAAELDAPVVFVYVRRGPAAFLGTPAYQRRLTAEMARARRVLAEALDAARAAGVDGDGEILEGAPRRRITEFARGRNARLVVVGSRRLKLGRSVSRGVAHAAGRPVVVAQALPRLALAGKAA